MFDEAFAAIALGFSATYGGPFADAVATWPGVPEKDDGGSITQSATPVTMPCKAQVTAPDERMRVDAGFMQTDMRLIVLRVSLGGVLNTKATIEVLTGPHAGTWELQTCGLDTAGIGWSCRGRKVI